MKNKINNIKDNNFKLKENNNKNNIYNNNENEDNFSNPKKIKLLNKINDSYSKYLLPNAFSIFKSINNILYLIYSNKNKSIICYDLIQNKKINEIKNAHNKYITNFRYYLDKINLRDLILSISAYGNNIKLWNINNLNCLLHIKNINKNGYLYSACFMNFNNNNYIITSNEHFELPDPIKVYDFKGNKIKEINDSFDYTYYIDNYYDKKSYKYYIIAGNLGYIKSYDYNEDQIYYIYSDDDDNKCHDCALIYDKEEIIKLIDSSEDGNIRIWNFHSGKLLKIIEVSDKKLYEICLWNKEYLFIGCSDKSIKLLNLRNGIIIKELTGHNNVVISIKKINHPKYGQYLISQGYDKDPIIIWEIK